MSNLKLSPNTRNGMLDVITTQVGASGYLYIFAGTQPSGGDAGSVLLAVLRCDTTFAGSATGGSLTVNPIASDASANATGTATYFRIVDSIGSWVMDGDISAPGGGGDMILDSTSIVLNGTVSLGGPNTITAPNAG